MRTLWLFLVVVFVLYCMSFVSVVHAHAWDPPTSYSVCVSQGYQKSACKKVFACIKKAVAGAETPAIAGERSYQCYIHIEDRD